MLSKWARVRRLTFKFFKDRPFLTNVLTIATSTTIAQAVPIIISPILTRIYSPSEYGILAMALLFAAIISIVANGRYELAIMLPKDDGDAANICVLSFMVALLIAGIVVVLCLLFFDRISYLLGEELPQTWLYFLGPLILLNGICQTFNYWFNRLKRYKALATSRIYGTVFAAAANLCLGFLGIGVWGLLISSLVGPLVTAGHLIKHSWECDKTYFNLISKKAIIENAKDYIDFPKKNVLSSLLSVLSDQAPIFLLGSLFGTSILGAYTLTLRVMTAPTAFLGNAFSQVLFQRYTEADRQGDLLQVVIKTTKILVALFFLPTLILQVFGDRIIEFVFGKDWFVAGEIIKILSVFYYVRFIVSVQNTLLIIKNELSVEAFFHFLLCLSRIVAIILGFYLLHDYYVAFIWISVIGTSLYALLGMFLYWRIKFNSKGI